MSKKILTIIPVLFLTLMFVFAADTASAATPLVPCDGSAANGGTACTFCHFVSLGNNIINWIFGFVFVIFGVIVFVAGFGLVTSGGNQSALDDAKKKLSNAVIGLIIVMAAWLIVDTLVKAALAGTSGNVGIGPLGPWHTIQCNVATQT